MGGHPRAHISQVISTASVPSRVGSDVHTSSWNKEELTKTFFSLFLTLVRHKLVFANFQIAQIRKHFIKNDVLKVKPKPLKAKVVSDRHRELCKI